MAKQVVCLFILLFLFMTSLWASVKTEPGRCMDFGGRACVVVAVFTEDGQLMWVVICRIESGWLIYCGNNPLCFVDPTGLTDEFSDLLKQNKYFKNRIVAVNENDLFKKFWAIMGFIPIAGTFTDLSDLAEAFDGNGFSEDDMDRVVK